jgi:bifunctional non-homologous end joining protein LigD
VRLTHPDRVLYPPQGITKHDLAALLRVHRQVDPSPREGPALTLVRCPEGTEKGCFYMKHSGVWAPEALRRVKIQEKTKVGEYLVADDVAGLISLVQMGILEIHTWNALADSIERPDRVVFDLDPDPSVGWDRVAASALALRKRLRELGLESFVKTTGGKGLHVVVPLRPASTWEESFAFSRAISEEREKAEPGPTRRPCRRRSGGGASFSTTCATTAAAPRSPPIRRARVRARPSRGRSRGKSSRAGSLPTSSTWATSGSAWPR